MPRTDTSEAIAQVELLVVRFCCLPSVSTLRNLYQNIKTGVTAVVTTIDAVNVFGGSGSEVAIGVAIANTSVQASLFGAQTGAGAFDTFSWRGVCALLTGDSLVMTAVAGAWDIIANGYFVPTVYQA